MKIAKNFKKAAALTLAGAMVLSLSTGAQADAAKKKKLDLNGKYHATMGIQTSTKLWYNHLGYYEKTQNKYYKTDKADKIVYTNPDTQEETTATGTFTDAEIAGNGTYTLKLEGADFQGETAISQLHIATDIPLNDKIKFTNVKAKVDGREVTSFDEGVPENEEPYFQGGTVILLMNHWRPELVKQLQEDGLSESAESGYDLLKGTTDESVEITFTVSGFNYDNPDAVEETPEPTQAADSSNVSGSTSGSETDSDSSGVPVVPIVIVVVVVVTIGGVMVFKSKKK
jgi:hypothetical protein